MFPCVSVFSGHQPHDNHMWRRVEWVPSHGSEVVESQLLAIMVGVDLLGKALVVHCSALE